MAKRCTSRAKSIHPALAGFTPPVARWFARTFRAPSPAQRLAWPAIRRGESTLLLAPTGSGKTLAAFLCAIDDLRRRAAAGGLADGVHVLYVSPLKALGNDIHRNLLEPLAGIDRIARTPAGIRIAVRTGDTPAAERQAMLRRPPHILITTPESLYLLLLSARMAPHLRTVRTVIVDEVHALCDNKRGVHLAVSLERLAARVEGPLQRVGCSATLSPLDAIAAFLVGRDATGRVRPCTILNAGMRKDLDVQVVAPMADFLEAGNTALWTSAYERLLEEIAAHRTTLVFCNSRYKAERTSLRLGELAEGKQRIGVHHGSMSKEIRLEAEERLKRGELDAMVATSSLELGIDVGSIDLVYQLESPKSISTGLQRIGRAGHLLDATSKGRVIVFERDDLLEAAAVCRAMVRGQIDAVHIPRGCLDVLAQQIAGAVAARDWRADELLAVLRGAYPYAALTDAEYESVLGMLAGEHAFQSAQAPLALVLWDRATGRLSAARGAAHVAAMCVGTIGETSEYEVVIDGSNKRVGKVQGEFVDDCLRIGDVFVLGSTSWKVVGVRQNRLIVTEAPAATPTVPWWHGPVEPRTAEVGAAVGELRRGIAERLDDPQLVDWLAAEYHLNPNGAAALAQYVREQRAAAGFVPDDRRMLLESWRDELGRANLILHCPFGQRINRTWGIALAEAARRSRRQRWSVTASNDLLLLTLPRAASRSQPKIDAAALLGAAPSADVAELVRAAAHGAASFSGAFKDAAVCALQILRAYAGRRVPFWLQNYRAQELFDAAGTCESYPICAEVMRGQLEESFDVPHLAELLGRIESGAVRVEVQEVDSPSPFAHSLLVGSLYGGDHQMGRDRRAQLLRLHRRVLQEVLTGEQMAELLDGRAIERVERRVGHRSETSRARSTDELAQVIRDLGDVPARVEAVAELTEGDAAGELAELAADRRIVAVQLPDCEQDPVRLVAADRWRQYYDAFGMSRGGRGQAVMRPRIEAGRIAGFDAAPAAEAIPARWRKRQDADAARAAVIERYLRCRGPVSLYEIVNRTGWPAHAVEAILRRLVAEGKAAEGIYTPDKPRPQWVNKANLEEVHRLTMRYLRRELAACAPYEVVDFLTRWQHLHPATRVSGIDGLREVIRQLQGFEIVTAGLEPELLAGRVADYRPEMLERLIGSGEVCWRRVSTRALQRGKVCLCFRRDGAWLARGAPLEFDALEKADEDIPDAIAAVRGFFRRSPTAFFDDVLEETHVEEGPAARAVWHLAWCGEIACDTYEPLRYADFQVTTSACYDLDSTPRKIVRGRITADRVYSQLKRKRMDPRLGRWWATERLVPPRQPLDAKTIVQRWAQQLLARWGIVSRDVLAAEVAAPPWAALAPEFKRLELLGKVSRGYFIESHAGEQYGLAEAIELLRDCRARRADGRELGCLPDEPVFAITTRDPANLYAYCLEILDERGQPLRRRMRRGNLVHRLAVQGGQVLIYQTTQLATLTRRQLVRCIDLMRHDYAGGEIPMRVRQWNGCPIDLSPVADVLGEMGFRFAADRSMRWPARRSDRPAPQASKEESFPPYFQQAPPVTDWQEYLLERAGERMRPTFRRVLKLVLPMLDAAGGWEVGGDSWAVHARYRGKGHMSCRCGARQVSVHAHSALYRDEAGKGHRVWRQIRAARPADVNDQFAAECRGILEAVQSITDRSLQPRSDPPTRQGK